MTTLRSPTTRNTVWTTSKFWFASQKSQSNPLVTRLMCLYRCRCIVLHFVIPLQYSQIKQLKHFLGCMCIWGRGGVQVSGHAKARQRDFLDDAGLPSRRSFSSLLASLLSRRSCFSISALIRLDSFASSLRQQAIMESKVITAWAEKPVWQGEPGYTSQMVK